ncbi:MAG: phosphotransferase [Candidatus Dependentiae bacterium]|nr:phosphotransferase [Candidatus Dependentiae bacterium]
MLELRRRQLEIICETVNVGHIITDPTPVAGGLLHEMWYVTTDRGHYAVKVLSPKIMQKMGVLDRYEATETIARMFFEKGIPAVVSITNDNKSVIELDNAFFIIYPWMPGTILSQNLTNREYAKKIATIVAQMHQLNLQLPKLTQATWDIHANSYYENLIAKAIKSNLPFASALHDLTADIFTWNEKYSHAITQLNKHTLISHGDLDQKNVLWTDDGNPMIIDWEAARLLNPTQDIICIALDWSGFPSGTINIEFFTSIINAYKKAGGTINKDDIQASFDCIRGNCLNWMAYNIERSLDGDDEKNKLGIAQVQQTLDLLVYLTSHIQTLASLL